MGHLIPTATFGLYPNYNLCSTCMIDGEANLQIMTIVRLVFYSCIIDSANLGNFEIVYFVQFAVFLIITVFDKYTSLSCFLGPNKAKETGGLDLRRLNILNDAMILKAFWVMVTKLENIWSQICKAKYDKMVYLMDFLTLPANSTTFNIIIQARGKILQHITIQMSHGIPAGIVALMMLCNQTYQICHTRMPPSGHKSEILMLFLGLRHFCGD
jgi:hypothetical protein